MGTGMHNGGGFLAEIFKSFVKYINVSRNVMLVHISLYLAKHTRNRLKISPRIETKSKTDRRRNFGLRCITENRAEFNSTQKKFKIITQQTLTYLKFRLKISVRY